MSLIVRSAFGARGAGRRLVARITPVAIAMFLVSARMASAGVTGSGIAGVDTAGTWVIKAVSIIAGIFAVVAVAGLLQNWLSRRNLVETFGELLGIAAFGYIATNPGVITTAIGLTGAQI